MSWKNGSDIESNSDPDSDAGGAFQAALSGLITKACGFAAGSLDSFLRAFQ